MSQSPPSPLHGVEKLRILSAMGTFHINALIRSTTSAAFPAYPSAPISSANFWVSGAPPTRTLIESRTPAFSNAAIVSPMAFMVVVSRADIPTKPGWWALTAGTRSGTSLLKFGEHPFARRHLIRHHRSPFVSSRIIVPSSSRIRFQNYALTNTFPSRMTTSPSNDKVGASMTTSKWIGALTSPPN
jgi:hypothetical protein